MLTRPRIRPAGTRAGRRGGALIASLIVVLFLATIAMAAFGASLAQKEEVRRASDELEALYLAEAGVSETLAELAAARRTRKTAPTKVGSKTVPRKLKRGRFWADVAERPDETFLVTATGATRRTSRTLEAIVAPVVADVFDHAIFAGNSSEDPNYTLRLSGVGGAADEIQGDVYSGNDVVLDDDATINGNTMAQGTISGTAGTEGITLPIPDIAGMNYETYNDVDVAAAFDAGGAWSANALGGSAWELPEADPAHIFRKNPDDRPEETTSTAKDDYFLEDPYMPVQDFTAAFNGKEGHTITLSGSMGHPGPSGNEKVYYIDGNLWVHNKPFGRLRFMDTNVGVRVTFVVKGNVYFSDDVLIENPDTDGVAFIAIADEDVADSGNIYMGDPRYGTLERMRAFLYAENDFVDYNLQADGSGTVELFGNMTAGNHVAIARDFLTELGDIVHSKLDVDFDERLSTGELVLPGLPRSRDERSAGLRVVLWREVARD